MENMEEKFTKITGNKCIPKGWKKKVISRAGESYHFPHKRSMDMDGSYLFYCRVPITMGFFITLQRLVHAGETCHKNDQKPYFRWVVKTLLPLCH